MPPVEDVLGRHVYQRQVVRGGCAGEKHHGVGVAPPGLDTIRRRLGASTAVKAAALNTMSWRDQSTSATVLATTWRTRFFDEGMRLKGGEKLFGTRRGHFGAFGDPRGRDSDYVWGRLDTASHTAKLLEQGEDARVATEPQVLASEGHADPDEFAKCPPAIGTCSTSLPGTTHGRAALQVLANSVLRSSRTTDRPSGDDPPCCPRVFVS